MLRSLLTLVLVVSLGLFVGCSGDEEAVLPASPPPGDDAAVEGPQDEAEAAVEKGGADAGLPDDEKAGEEQ